MIKMKFKYLTPIFLLCCLTLSVTNAQPLTKSSLDKLLSAADEALAANNQYAALEKYEEAYKEDRDLETMKKVADLHYALRDYEKAEKWFGRIVNKKSRKTPNPYLPEARYTHGHLLKLNGNYIDAIATLQVYIAEAEDPIKIARAKKAIEGAKMAKEMDAVSGLTVENAGKNINSKNSEYSPLYFNENEIYYTSLLSDDVVVLDGKAEEVFVKLYKSTKGEKGWGKGTQVGPETIHREGYHIGNFTFSKDKNTIYFTRQLLDGNLLASSQIYSSTRDGDGWNPAQPMAGINGAGDYVVKQPAIGELYGNDVMFFVSDMEGGYGGFDLYYATKTGEGYTNPVNLGDVINSDQDEETPFYLDGTLYLSSNGHPGIGGYDVFKSNWDGANWSSPENMGKPFNTQVDDLYFSTDKEGLNSLIISNRIGNRSVKSETCCDDIWTITKEEVVVDLLTTITSEGQPLPGASVQLVEMVNNTPGVTNEKTKEEESAFPFPLKREMAYIVIASKEGFYSDTIAFNTTGIEKSITITNGIELKKIPPPPPPPPVEEYEEYTINEAIRLNNIYYDYDDDKILTDAEDDLSIIFDLLNQYGDMVIELSSHTDSRGITGYNQKLSQRRAESAKSWLLAKGIAPERINAVGYGEELILNRCTNGVKCSDDEHRFNRRTEFKIISGPTTIKIKKTRLRKKG